MRLDSNIEQKSLNNTYLNEASLHDRIKMTKFWLDFDRETFTPMNINVRT